MCGSFQNSEREKNIFETAFFHQQNCYEWRAKEFYEPFNWEIEGQKPFVYLQV